MYKDPGSNLIWPWRDKHCCHYTYWS